MASVRSSRLSSLLWLLVQLLHQSDASHSTNTCTWSVTGFPFPLGLETCPLPINRRSALRAGKWSPWSHLPVCNTPLERDSPQYCLFTDDKFRGGHGVSILTTAEIAAGMATALDDSSVPPSIRDFNSDRVKAPYKFVDIPGRGKSTVATRNIKELETIMIEYPALLTLNDIQGASFEDIMDLLQKAADQLPSKTRENLYSLAQSNGDDMAIRDIIRTNSYGLDLNEVRHMAVFPGSSRMNHDCRPNTFYRLLPHILVQQVIAARDIQAGEEITHSYTGHGMPYEDRQRTLSGWNFNCTCSLCTASPKERARSDKRRYRLRDILQELTSPYSGGTKKLGKMLKETQDLVKKEEMSFLIGNFYAGFAWAYLASRDLKNARKYGLLAEEMGERYGQEDGVSQIMGNFWQAVKR